MLLFFLFFMATKETRSWLVFAVSTNKIKNMEGIEDIEDGSQIFYSSTALWPSIKVLSISFFARWKYNLAIASFCIWIGCAKRLKKYAVMLLLWTSNGHVASTYLSKSIIYPEQFALWNFFVTVWRNLAVKFVLRGLKIGFTLFLTKKSRCECRGPIVIKHHLGMNGVILKTYCLLQTKSSRLHELG